MDEAVKDFETFDFKHAICNVGARGITVMSYDSICHITASNEELKAFGEFLVAYANKADELEDSHPMGQS